MAEKFLDGSPLQADAWQRNVERVIADALDYPCLAHRFLDCPLEYGFMNVVPPFLPGPGVLPPVFLGE